MRAVETTCKPGFRARLGILGTGVAALVCSCTVGPDYTTPRANVASQWLPNPATTNRPYSTPEIYWWRDFHDPVLDGLIAAAYQNNPTLQIAGVRVLETRARLNKSIGKLFPQQQGISGQVGYARLNDGLTSMIPGVDPDYLSANTLFGATWEIDFWGKYRRGIAADRATYLGSIAAYDDALVTLIADVASSYVNVRTFEERLRVARRNLATQQASLRIATVQFNAGETSELDVQQATTQLAQTEAKVPLLEQSLSQARNGLALLLGDTPDQLQQRLTGPGRIPIAPDTVAVGIPKDLLRRRPDVRAAGFAAASKSALIGVAQAQMYPAFSLSGQFGVTANNEAGNSLGDMFSWESRALNAGAGLVWPVFNYGRLVNQVRVQDAQFQAAVLNYQNTVLVAQQEVENGLATFADQQRAVLLFGRAATAAKRTTELAMIQYQGGQTDYTTVLTAEQGELAVEDSLASAQGNVVLGLISVYRALGGGWQLREGHDVISDEVKAAMARRTDWGRLLEPSKHLPDTTAWNETAQPPGAK
jgi:NodT family efflux transporter outer membrane factor (OMF) lipoprotein